MSHDICFAPARELCGRMAARELSATELMRSTLERIEAVNPVLNAICTLEADRALEAASEADHRAAGLEPLGALHGLPIAIKDLVLTRGIRTTFGSRVYRDFIPDQDALLVERLKAAGAIIIGKTNTPEFGAGSQTFNEVFGATRNPYDLSRTCGGSSGGAAVALASGLVALADGSDLGGSLRNPASFCNVVGFRPSPGRVPTWPDTAPWDPLPVAGPMARSVADLALMLSVIAGPDPRTPMAIDEPGAVFDRPLERDFQGARIAWSADLGRYPVEPQVLSACQQSLGNLVDMGCEVEHATPDFSDADEIFNVLRAHLFASGLATEYREHRDLLKDTVVWNIERGLRLSEREIAVAMQKRTAFCQQVRAFMEDYEFLLLPVSQVAPFPIEQEWVEEINGIKMQSYIDWMASCYAISCTGLPAISIPCGFTSDGLPIGLQIVGRHHADFDVLQLAHAFEQATRVGERRPTL